MTADPVAAWAGRRAGSSFDRSTRLVVLSQGGSKEIAMTGLPVPASVLDLSFRSPER